MERDAELIRSVCNSFVELKTHQRLFEELPILAKTDFAVFYCAKVFLLQRCFEVQNPNDDLDKLKQIFNHELRQERDRKPEFSLQANVEVVTAAVGTRCKALANAREAPPSSYDFELLKKLELACSMLVMLTMFKSLSPERLEKISVLRASVMEFTQKVRSTLITRYGTLENLEKTCEKNFKAEPKFFDGLPIGQTQNNAQNNAQKLEYSDRRQVAIQSAKFAKLFPLSMAFNSTFSRFEKKYDMNAMFNSKPVSNMK